MSVFINGIAIKFYRGIGPDIQYIKPFSKMNFFIGPNNSGKSIILNLISTKLESILTKPHTNLDPVEAYIGANTGQFFIAIGVDPRLISDLIWTHIQSNNRFVGYAHEKLNIEIENIIKNLTVNEFVWLHKHENQQNIFPPVDLALAANWSVHWDQIWTLLTGSTGGDIHAHWIPQTIRFMSNIVQINLPKSYLIPAKRIFGKTGESFDDLSGKGLIDHLATLQNPSFNRQMDREKFHRINLFVQEITGKNTAHLEIPSDREHLLVHMDNKVLPLSALGTGIHEVVLIASLCTVHDGSIMCIEEPEIHLHPLLQRKLAKYLYENTNNQYIIATHSSAFIDTVGASIFRVYNDGSQTYISPALTKDSQREILDDLGCNASDILQSNAVIWVEGPSDRIYIRHWLKSYDSRLVEGINYNIMLFGGSLIRHLTASDDALEDFIRLRDLNRNMAIVIDSDRDSPNSELKTHIQRLSQEMISGKITSWITEGREIENYVNGSDIQDALKKIHPNIYHSPYKTGQYDHAFYFWRKDPDNAEGKKIYKFGDKVGVANIICSKPANLNILDLKERIADLAKMITSANNL